ncbi:DMT family transporter [uncultured Bartonella sp.]|uniref:DMT family transporter n=1 Tax=uncultured Bartonella sp. TaxID=104108 RepID=UPI00263818C0|nr:DMT family transporter [uncultured Bartonella sp.]
MNWFKAVKMSDHVVLFGMLLMLLGDFMFAANDAMGKWLVATFTVGQVLLLRSIGAFLILGPMLTTVSVDDLFKPKKPFLIFLRVVCATMDTGLFYAAVAYLPLADVVTFYMAGPIYVAAVSHFFLNERIGWRRWLAIMVGFVGVIIALRPSSAMLSWPSVFALLGSFGFAMVIVFSRVLKDVSDTVLVTWQTFAALLVGLVLTINNWVQPTMLEWGAMALLGIVSCGGHLLIARSLKLAPASVLAPLQYSLLLWGIIFGIMFFNDYPDFHILIGAAIIIFAGLFIFHRKQIVDHKIPQEDIAKIKQ